MKIQAILFDMDGILINSVDLHAEAWSRIRQDFLPQVRPLPAVRALPEQIIADGKKIALAPSSNKADLQEYKKIAGIADLLDAATSADDAERSKPEPDIFHAALDRLGRPDPSRVVAVGDTPYDAIAAGMAGVRTVGLICGGFGVDHLREAGCVAFLHEDPADLLAHYDESPLAG